jgi:hypothetical protein
MTGPRVFVVDTSYLCEFYEVPGKCESGFAARLRKRMAQEIDRNSRFYVPVPAFFELANHVAQVSSGTPRRKLATRLANDIRTSLDGQPQWVVESSRKDALLTAAELLASLREFEQQFALVSVGLTDIAAVRLSRRLAEQYAAKKWHVHIWTRDAVLKTHEPQAEPDPVR